MWDQEGQSTTAGTGKFFSAFLEGVGVVKYEVLLETLLLRIYPKEMMTDLGGIMYLPSFIKFGNKVNVLQ